MLEAGVGDGYLLPMSTAVIRDDRIQEIDDDDIDYELSDPNTLLGSHANMIPLPSNVQAPRVFYGARFYNQALPVKGREAPLVQNLMYGSKEGKSFDEHYGAAAGALRADDDYEVQEVTPDYMTLRRVSDGETVRKELYNRLPFNRKSAITHTSLVKPGDKVGKGSMLASTEYTDDEGTLALGANARVGIVPYKGHSIDDAVVISKSFSQRLTSPITKTLTQRIDNGVKTGRNHFRALFPEKYTVRQLEALDENGVVTPGSVVKPGDPIILATKPKVMSSRSGEIGNLSKSMTNVRSDASQFWDGEEEAEVMDVAKTKDGFKVIMRYETPVKDADKLVFRTGQKGVTAKIIPDEHMPRTLDGKPLEVLLNPQGLPSRANFSLLYEVLAGKVAAATGKPVKLPAFTKPGEETYDLIEKMLSDAGLTDKEEVFDPMENRKLENPITVGNAYVLRLHHTGASKADSRGQGSYTKDDLPAKGGEGGAKRISGLEVNALMSSGAYATLREGATIRGTRSDDFWRTLREGNTPTKPGAPFVWNKYRALMSGAGMRMRDEGGGNIRLGPMTDEDVDKHKPIEIKNPRLINFKTMAPEEGGLFDPTLVATNKWGTITLPEPVINPAFEDVVRHLLGLKRKDLEAIMAGDMDLPPDILQKVQGRRKSASGVDAGIPGPEEEDDTPTTGPAAIRAALETVDLDVLEQDHRRIIDSGKVSKRKASVQALNAIEGLRKNQVKPTQLMVTKVPVVPPAFRPFSVAGDTFVPGDANELYKDLFDIRDAFKESKAVFGDRGVTGERRALQNAVRAVYGFAEPVNPKTRQRGVSGFLRQISGTNPKQSFLQSKMIAKPQDQTARGVIIPDPSLKMNQIGVPEDMAWNMYSSFVRRRLVRGGMKRRDALEHLKERSDFAKRALQAEMKDRYVIYSRSPAWHRTNIISAEPQLVEGDAIKISPFVTTGQAGDFDGDCCRLWLTILQGGAESSHMFKDVGIKTGAVTSIRIEDMPRVEGSERQVSPTVVEYDVPSETYTLAYDTQTGEQGWYEISKFSVHEELTLHSINAGKDSFLASTDHSLIAFSRETNKVERVPPSAVITQKSSEKNWHAPCSVRGLIEADLGKSISGPHERVYADYDLGFALGVYAGDGAFSISNGEIVKALYLYGGATDSSRRKKATHMKAATTLWELFGCDSNPPRYDQYARESLGDKIGMSGRTSFNAGKEQEYMRIGYEWLKDLCGDTAEGKTLPAGMLDVHEEFRWGLFCGVIASDGTVTVTHGKAKPQLSVGLNSITSLTLASDFMALCSSLGLRAGLTEAKRKTMTGKSEYTVSVSTADLAARWKKEPFSLGCAERDELIAEYLPQVRIENTLDSVPFPGGELGMSLRNAYWEMNGQVKRGTKRNFGAGGEWFVKGAAHRVVLLPQLPALADWVRENNPELTEELDDYVRIVSDENVRWNEIIVGDAIVGETGYDITVPGPYTFCTAGGTFVYDTISLHVPATKESMEEAKSKLLPSSMLFSIKDRGRIVPALKHEQVLGLYTASKRPSKAVHRFASKEEAMDAVRRKLVPLSDEIEFPD